MKTRSFLIPHFQPIIIKMDGPFEIWIENLKRTNRKMLSSGPSGHTIVLFQHLNFLSLKDYDCIAFFSESHSLP
jgi:hypothetical protein